MAAGRAEAKARPAVVAALEHMTGVARGETDWVVADRTLAVVGPDRRLRLHDEAGAAEAAGEAMALLLHRDGGYILEVPAGQTVWVNGVAVSGRRRQLAQNDVVEFGEMGPISRLTLYQQGGRPHHTAAAILADAAAYLRVSRRSWPVKLWRAFASLVRRLARETSFLFRGVVLAAILGLVFVVYRQDQLNSRLEQEIASGAARLEGFRAALARSRDEALTPAELNALSDELRRGLTTAADRLAALEARSQATADVIAAARPSVAFIQGAYGFKEERTGRMLRHVIGADGKPVISPQGQPMLALGGPGPVAERMYTGTGFALASPRAIVTNRHVALPWEKDASSTSLVQQGLAPVMLKLVAYFPDEPEALELTLARASDAADLAVLRPTAAGGTFAAPGLTLAVAPPRQGAEVIVMGYPTGLRSLLAQTGEAFVEGLKAANATDFWAVAARLASAGHIAPLASRGIVAQATFATIVYDAETTHGGSGGPVLGAGGRVVAVNTAILPEYGGSNLGVPAALLHDLLEGF